MESNNLPQQSISSLVQELGVVQESSMYTCTKDTGICTAMRQSISLQNAKSFHHMTPKILDSCRKNKESYI